VGPRAVLDAVVKRKISNPSRESNPRTPIAQPIAAAVAYFERSSMSTGFTDENHENLR
jgi:hypothetical protein